MWRTHSVTDTAYRLRVAYPVMIIIVVAVGVMCAGYALFDLLRSLVPNPAVALAGVLGLLSVGGGARLRVRVDHGPTVELAWCFLGWALYRRTLVGVVRAACIGDPADETWVVEITARDGTMTDVWCRKPDSRRLAAWLEAALDQQRCVAPA